MKIHILLLKKLVRRIPFIVTQTEAVKQGLIKELGKNPEHIRVINNVLPAVYASLENNRHKPYQLKLTKSLPYRRPAHS